MSENTLKSYVIDIFESITDYECVELTDEEFEDIAIELVHCSFLNESDVEKLINLTLQSKGYEYNEEDCIWELPEKETEVEEVHKSDLRLLIESMYDTPKLEYLKRKIDKRLAEIKKELVDFISDETGDNIEDFKNDPRFIVNNFHHRLTIKPKIRRDCVEVVLTISHTVISFDKLITDESQIGEEFDRWVIRQTLDYMTKELI